MELRLSSPAFQNGSPIPTRHTCDGENLSPALEWSNVPAEARSLALMVEDPDAPSGTFIHWLFYNLAPTRLGLPEGVQPEAQLADLGTHGTNSARTSGYRGPCPPAGKPHRYFFRLYAMDLPPTLESRLNSEDLQRSLRGHILASAEWMGTYQRR